MKGFLIALAVIVGIIAFIGLSIVSVNVSTYNKAQEFEAEIIASWEQMQNVNGYLVNTIKTSGFTVQNYGKTFIDSIEANVKRYANDKTLLMKWVQESQAQSPDKELWTNLQKTIESGYLKFEMSQKDKIDRVRVYRMYSKKFPNNIILKSYNLPSEECLMIMDKVISTADTKKTFQTGNMEAVSPF